MDKWMEVQADMKNRLAPEQNSSITDFAHKYCLINTADNNTGVKNINIISYDKLTYRRTYESTQNNQHNKTYLKHEMYQSRAYLNTKQ